jgi:flagellar export protein FliJ
LPVFEFRLAPVLRLRERVQEEKEAELRALNLERAQRESEIAALTAELDRLSTDLGTQIGLIISPIELKLQGEYAQLLSATIERREQALKVLAEQAARKRQELTEAMRDVKSLEILRQRLAEQFRREQNAAEQKFLDELGQRNFARGTGRQ